VASRPAATPEGGNPARERVTPEGPRAPERGGGVVPREPAVERGTLEVRLVDPKRLLDDDARVHAWSSSEPVVPAVRTGPGRFPQARGSRAQPFVRGVARLSVAVGGNYVVRLTWHDTTLAQKPVRGPAEAGETVACTIDVPSDQALLVARIGPGWVRSDTNLPPGVPGPPKVLPYVVLHRAIPAGEAASRPRAAQDKFTARVDVGNRITAFLTREWHGAELGWVEVFLDGQTRSVAADVAADRARRERPRAPRAREPDRGRARARARRAQPTT
jgi:hypothetical protein